MIAQLGLNFSLLNYFPSTPTRTKLERQVILKKLYPARGLLVQQLDGYSEGYTRSDATFGAQREEYGCYLRHLYLLPEVKWLPYNHVMVSLLRF